MGFDVSKHFTTFLNRNGRISPFLFFVARVGFSTAFALIQSGEITSEFFKERIYEKSNKIFRTNNYDNRIFDCDFDN